MKTYGIDANNFFLTNSFRDHYYNAARQCGLDPKQLSLIPTMTPAGFTVERHIIAQLPKHEYIKTAIQSKYTMQFNGKPLFLGYSSERCTPEQLNNFIQILEKIGGKKSLISAIRRATAPRSGWAVTGPNASRFRPQIF